ncbi:hypothetical protein MNBD_GAMMA22-1116 [hydrothermal vent metagenome]|uniref:STAS domain-containing protein n=1 Tax=hydrothermal vent metagenome TaxID=652676 RepID=A0A3B1AJ65_9ZZZZ
MSVTTSLTNDNSVLTLSIHGAFDFSVVYDFRASYTQIDHKPETVVVDFNDTVHLDSSALGMLLNLKRYMAADNLAIKIINARSEVKKILKIAHFERFFSIS